MSINASTHVYSENAVEEATETTLLLGNVSIYKLFHSLLIIPIYITRLNDFTFNLSEKTSKECQESHD